MSFYATSPENEAVISPNTTCLLNFNETALCQTIKTENCNVTCDNFENNYCLYTSTTFWGFVFLMSLGTIGIVTSFNINNAICFEILGKYLYNYYIFSLIVFIEIYIKKLSELNIYNNYSNIYFFIYFYERYVKLMKYYINFP